MKKGKHVSVNVQELWGTICRQVESDPRYELLSPWMGELDLDDSASNRLRVRLRNRGLQPYLTRQHLHLLSEAATPAQGEAPSVVLASDDGAPALEYLPPKSAAPATTPPSEATTTAPEARTPPKFATTGLNGDYTFENLVLGPANRLAYAAAQAVASRPGQTYNPLFVHGPVGMGKTHLLQAICHQVAQVQPGCRAEYVLTENLVHALGASASPGALETLRNRIRQADVLVVDNVHLLAEHDSAQEEFFTLFNALYNQHKQIVVSSSASPMTMEGMREALLSRFKWGLIVELEPPTPEMKLGIIRRKSEQTGFVLPEEVQTFLSENVTGNIRELEGALMKLMGYTSLLNQSLDVSIAKQVLREYLPLSGSRNITIKDIQTTTCEAFNITLADMLSKKRARSLVLPRHIAMYLVRHLTNASLEEVGLHFGGRDHSTVKHGCEKVMQLLESDANIQFTVNAIKRKLLATG